MYLKKLFVFFIMMLLIGTAISSVGMINEKISNDVKFDNNYENINLIYDYSCENKNRFLNPPFLAIDLKSINIEPITYETVIVTPPDYFSWKDFEGQDWTTNAKHQSVPKGCGSCWNFAAIAALESVINIREGIADLDPDLSEQYVLSCLSISGSCNGGDPGMAYQFIKSNTSLGNNVNGIIPESCFQYQADDSISCDEKSDDWMEFIVPITDCGNFYPSIDNIKSKIMENGPVTANFYANENFMNWGWNNHDPEEYYPFELVPLLEVNHCIIVVGWKDDSSIGKGGYWICKNSWGSDWGYDGFFNIEYHSLAFNATFCCWADYDPESYDWHPTPKTNGPYYGLINEPLEFKGETGGEHPPFTFHWDFGDESYSEEQNPAHTYTSEGKYDVTLTVTDDNDESFYEKTTVWIQETNSPPDTPIIDGSAEIVKDEYCWYNISYSDPDDSPIYVREIVFEWDDGGWWGPFEFGEPVERNWYWNWTEEGDYIVKAKARDVYGAESDWAILEVTVPRSKQINDYNLWISRLIERFPILKLLI
jgi:C1A family cysteine protease